MMPSRGGATRRAKHRDAIMQNAINSGSMPLTAQMRLSGDQRSMDMVIRPFFDMVRRAKSPRN